MARKRKAKKAQTLQPVSKKEKARILRNVRERIAFWKSSSHPYKAAHIADMEAIRERTNRRPVVG